MLVMLTTACGSSGRGATYSGGPSSETLAGGGAAPEQAAVAIKMRPNPQARVTIGVCGRRVTSATPPRLADDQLAAT
jgi:hypothetical protein